VKYLLDTHLLLWATYAPNRLSKSVLAVLDDHAAEVLFSAVSIWEAAIKQALDRADFRIDARDMRRVLLETGYREVAATSEHGLATLSLPLLHKDPFDRLLIAQATVEGAILLTADGALARYPGPIQRV
jgi:PIN domain nuclease of toxin-antitoxin system